MAFFLFNYILRQLNLEGTPISDVALKQIGQFPLLEELDLSNTSISDAGVAQLVAQLKSLPKLNVLWLTNTRITDASLKHLSNLLTEFHVLQLC